MEDKKTGNKKIRELLLKYKEFRKMSDASFLCFCRRYSRCTPSIVADYLREIYGALPYNASQLIQEEAAKFVEEYEKIV